MAIDPDRIHTPSSEDLHPPSSAHTSSRHTSAHNVYPTPATTPATARAPSTHRLPSSTASTTTATTAEPQPRSTFIPAPARSSSPVGRTGRAGARSSSPLPARSGSPDSLLQAQTDVEGLGGRERRVRKSVNYAEPKLNTYVAFLCSYHSGASFMLTICAWYSLCGPIGKCVSRTHHPNRH